MSNRRGDVISSGVGSLYLRTLNRPLFLRFQYAFWDWVSFFDFTPLAPQYITEDADAH
ncbi:hypothetical protein BCU00_005375 [Vibrio breoganii]|uniref:hypothetical protein n=1 Tax=Vibrio breoganii TaxID=553239 RepID=UPI0012FFD92F|nr:hypothetical protein [Vibrio breoganii]